MAKTNDDPSAKEAPVKKKTPRKRNRKKPNADQRFWKKGIDKNKVAELRRQGKRNGEIAKIVGCSPGRVTNILKEMSVVTQEQLDAIDKGKVWALYRAGWTPSAISFDVRCAEEAVLEILRAG